VGLGWLGEVTGDVAAGDTTLASPDDSVETPAWRSPFVLGVAFGVGNWAVAGRCCAIDDWMSDAGAPGFGSRRCCGAAPRDGCERVG